jgi:hypothetical protein
LTCKRALDDDEYSHTREHQPDYRHRDETTDEPRLTTRRKPPQRPEIHHGRLGTVAGGTVAEGTVTDGVVATGVVTEGTVAAGVATAEVVTTGVVESVVDTVRVVTGVVV